MKTIMIACAALAISAGAAAAQNSMNSDKTSPGTTGALKNADAPAIATDPQQVQAQQGDASKQSAGTVGAAPGADTNSQKPMDKK